MIGRFGRVALVAALVGAGVVLTPTAPAAIAAVPLPNPPITKACGIDLTLVLDASGSVNSAHAVEDVRSAGQAFLDGLKGTTRPRGYCSSPPRRSSWRAGRSSTTRA